MSRDAEGPTHLCFLDMETTSADADRCEPIDCSFIRVALDEFAEDPESAEAVDLTFLCHPGCNIPAEATEIHGYTDDHVRGCLPFRDYAGQVQEMVDGAILVGYNLRTFDSIIIDRKLREAGERGLERNDPKRPTRITHPEIDLLELWHHFEPRTLAGAQQRFVGSVVEGAHKARGDAAVLPAVLAGMALAGFIGWPLAMEGSTEDLAELARLSVPEGEVDRAGNFVRRADGTVLLNIGDHKGKPAAQVPGDFYNWMLRKDFPEETKEIVRWYLARRGGR